MPYTKEQASKYYHANKDKLKQKNKIYREKNKERIRAHGNQYREANYENDIFLRCRTNARRQLLPFNLERSDIVIPATCPYLGVPLTRTQGQGKVQTNASIDRIIPANGYVKGNIRIVSELSNRMKQNATIEELLIFAENILRLHQ